MLLWAQDPTNNEFQDEAAIAQMYANFKEGVANPLTLLQNDDRPHIILIFKGGRAFPRYPPPSHDTFPRTYGKPYDL